MSELTTMNTTVVAGADVLDPIPGVLCPNAFEMHTGAYRWGVGRFLVTRKDYEEKIATRNDPRLIIQTLVNGAPSSDGVNLPIDVAGYRPVSRVAAENAGAEVPEVGGLSDVVEVIVFDRRNRFQFNNIASKAYNVRRPGTEKFYYYTLKGDFPGDEWTWAEVLADGELSLNGGIVVAPDDLPSWKPRNLLFDGISRARALDEIAAQLFYVIGCDWHSVTPTLYFYIPGEMSEYNVDLAEKIKTRLGPGWWTLHTAARHSRRMPKYLDVRFSTQSVGHEMEPHYSRFTYARKATGVGTEDTNIDSIHIGGHIGVWIGGTLKNSAELDAVAADVATRYGVWVSQEIQEVAIPGAWPFVPDGAIRGVRWIASNRGTYTVLRMNTDRDWDPFSERVRASDPNSRPVIMGVGGVVVDTVPSGAKIVREAAPHISFWAEITGEAAGGLYPWQDVANPDTRNSDVFSGAAEVNGFGGLITGWRVRMFMDLDGNFKFLIPVPDFADDGGLGYDDDGKVVLIPKDPGMVTVDSDGVDIKVERGADRDGLPVWNVANDKYQFLVAPASGKYRLISNGGAIGWESTT